MTSGRSRLRPRRRCLRSLLSSLDNWSTRNNLKFNESKCKVLSITRKKHPICFNYKLGSTDLLKVKEEKDLGVTVTDTLSWNPHIQNIVSKANKLLGLLKRTCPLLPDANVRGTLYLSIVKSQLSYATVVWSPHHIYLKLKIERVQRRATRWILKERLHESSYKERLIKLNMLPLFITVCMEYRLLTLTTLLTLFPTTAQETALIRKYC